MARRPAKILNRTDEKDAFPGYYRWDVYYRTTSGDALLPTGYAEDAPIPVEQYLAAHPQ